MRPRIMVVDDDPLICHLLQYQLGGAGYQVSTAKDGRDALRRIPTDRPDLVLLDVVMPNMSGWDVCRQIRTRSTVPIIMLTARSSESDVVTGLSGGADDYISKPFSLRHLQARVEAVLRRSQYASFLQPWPHHPSNNVASFSAHNELSQPCLHPPLSLAGVGEAAAAPKAASPASPPYKLLGNTFANARQKRGLSLYQAEMACGVRWDFLQALEREHFHYIPRSQIRQAIKTYSDFLGIDLRAIIGPRQSPPPLPLWPFYLFTIVAGSLLLAMISYLLVAIN